MKLKVDELLPLINKWVTAVIMPKSDGLQKGFIKFFLLQRGSEIPEFFKHFADKEGTIDTDNLKVALEAAGGKITLPLINWDFDQADLDKLVEIANGNTQLR